MKVGHPAAARSDRIGRSCARLFANRGKHVGSVSFVSDARASFFPLVEWNRYIQNYRFYSSIFQLFLKFKLKKIPLILII